MTCKEYLLLPFFFFISAVPVSSSRKKRHKETKRRCLILEIVRLIQGHTKTFRAGKLTSITIATPSGNLWPNPQWIWLLISHTVTVSRGVGGWGPCERVVWVRDDHRPVVIYLCWLVALSSSAWVACCYIIHETDDWPWQDAKPGGVCLCVCLVCVVRERNKLQNVKKRGFWCMCANNKNTFTASVS